ncbi:hypothetical protein FRB95_001233 [Tulasnella sp. JGI-2019a]|nr:hypothetical protein FRB95_001233 [Tulasnella sp. JGI-2019a]
MRPLETKPQHSLDKNAVLGSRIGEFTAVLEKIKQDMSTLMSRRRLKRLFTYANDTFKLAEMKRRVDEASRGLQLEIIVTTGHEVDVISQEQRLVFQKQEVVIQQQYLANQQLCLVIQKQQEAGVYHLPLKSSLDRSRWFYFILCKISIASSSCSVTEIPAQLKSGRAWMGHASLYWKGSHDG